MKNKTLAIIVLCAIIILPLIILLVDFGSINFSLNLKKYLSVSEGEYTFDFYGSFGRVNKMTVRGASGKLCSLPMQIDSDSLSECDDPILICDFSENGSDLLLVFSSLDSDGDIHRTPFVRRDEAFEQISDADIVNPKIQNEVIICEEYIFEYVATAEEDGDIPYEIWSKRTEYVYENGTLHPSNALYVTYYSYTDIYCVGAWEYNSEYSELMSTDEDWLSAEQYSKVYGDLDDIFEIDIPD